DLGDLFDRRPGHPAFLALGEIECGDHRAHLTALRILRDDAIEPRLVLGIERKACRLIRGEITGTHRSTSPNTISMEPSTAGTSASMWPRSIMSMASRWAKPGARMRQR